MPYADPVASYLFHDSHRQEDAAQNRQLNPRNRAQGERIAARIRELMATAAALSQAIPMCHERLVADLERNLRVASLLCGELREAMYEAEESEEEAGEEVIRSAA